MFRKIIFGALGIALLASPVIVSAQTSTSSNASLIAVLTQLVQLLEKEIAALIGTQGGSTVPSTPTTQPTMPTTPANSMDFTAYPASGASPLTVDFIVNNNAIGITSVIDFGDGISGRTINFEDTAPSKYQISFIHIYTSPGTYMATLYDSSGNPLANQKITVS